MSPRSVQLSRRWSRVALLSSVAFAAAEMPHAAAQSGPPAPTELPVLVPAGDGGAVIGQTGDTRTVDIGAQNRAIQWRTFNVGSDASVVFSGAAAGRLTVLNSVDAANGLSQIYGKVVSQNNITVWLSNPTGILFGPSGAFTGGSLVLTTAQIGGISPTALNDPLAPTASVTLGGMPSGGVITVASSLPNGNADGTATPGSVTGLQVQGSLLIAAQAVEVSGVAQASGAIDLVAAQSVDVALDRGSPIGVSITRGTTLGRLIVAGTGNVSAGDVRLSGAATSAGDVLLGIDPGARLTASNAGGRVLISAGVTDGAAPSAARIETAGTLSAADSVTIQAAGTLADRGGAAGAVGAGLRGITLDGGVGVALGSALTTTGSVTATSSLGLVALTGPVDAAGDYRITAATGATLGGAASPVVQRAGNAIAVDSGTGTLVGVTGLTLTADAPAGSVTLTSGGAGGIAFAPDAAIVAGVADASGSYSGALTLRPGSAPIALGTVDAGRIALPDTGGTSLAASFAAERVSVRDALTLRSTAGALSLGTVRSYAGGVTLASDTAAVLVDSARSAGDLAITAATDVAGRSAGAGPDDGRLLTAQGRSALSADGAGARIAVTAGGTAQLGDVLAGVGTGAATDRTLNQVALRAARIDAATAVDAAGVPVQAIRAGQGNLVVASTGATRLGFGDAAGGVEAYDGVAGTYGAGLSVGTDAQIGTLAARGGDLRLAVPGIVSGLSLPGAAAATAVADGLTLADGGTAGALGIVAAGDLTVAASTSGAASTFTTAASIRIGTATAATGLTANAGLSVTGLPTAGIATAAAGANLLADTGSILLPAAGSAAGAVAVLGTVSAANGSVSLRAGRLSAQSVTAGGAASLTATGSGLVVGTLRANTAALSTQVLAALADADGLEVALDRAADTATLRTGFGFANLATTGADALLTVTAGRAAQFGQVLAGTAAAGLRTGNQIAVTGRAITAQTLVAANGALQLAATAGDLYLGSPAKEAGPLATVATAGAGALLDKTGVTGTFRIAGGLAAGTQAGSTGDVLVTSDTGILGRAIASTTGSIRLRADRTVGGFDPALTAAVAGELVIGAASLGSADIDAGGDVRIGALAADGTIDITAGGSVTGLGSAGAAGPLALDLTASGGLVDVRARNATLATATLGAVSARDGIAVEADAIALRSAATAAALRLAAAGGTATIAPTLLQVADDGAPSVETLATGYGFADLLSTAPAGSVTVAAGWVAQLGTVTAGTGATPLVDGSGAAANQIDVTGQALTIDAATSINGGLRLAASTGGLYLRTGAAGTFATLAKQGTLGDPATDAAANELRLGTLAAGTLRLPALAFSGRTVIDSATGVRLGSAIAYGTDASQPPLLQVTARGGDVSGLADAAVADGRLLGGYGRAGLFAPDASARIVATATGTAQLGAVVAGVESAAAVGTGAVDATLDQVVISAAAIDAATATGQRVAAGQGNLVLTSAGALRLGVGEAGAGVEDYLGAGTPNGAGLQAGGNAEVGRLTALTGDLRLRVAGALTGLILPETPVAFPASSDGLVLADATVGSIEVDGGGSVRLGTLDATGTVSVSAARDVTGLGGAAASPVADLIAERGSIFLPDSGAPGRTALLGRVEAAQGTVSLAAGTLSVARLVAATATLSASDAAPAGSDDRLLVAADRTLRSGYGFANLSAAGTGAPLTVTAGGTAQSGQVTAGGPVSVTADALTISRIASRNATLTLTTRAGDLYLGDQGAALDATEVARAGTAALLTKRDDRGLGADAAGLVWVSGRLVASDAVTVSTATGLRAREIESTNGSIAITAATLAGGFGTGAPNTADARLSGGLGVDGLAADRLAGDGIRLAAGTVAGEALIDGTAGVADGGAGVDVRFGRLDSATRIDVAASGSVTGLALPDLPVSATLDLRAANGAIAVRAATGRLGSVTVDGAIAGTTLAIEADRIAVRDARSMADATTLVSGSGLSVDMLTSGGAALIRADAPTSAAAAVQLTTLDDTTRLAAGFGDADLRVTSAGTIRVIAGQVAQLGTVAAGTGTTRLLTAAGTPREQVSVAARALSVVRTDAFNGALALDAGRGGLYLGNGTAALTARLAKLGASGTDADVLGNVVRIGTLTAGVLLTAADTLPQPATLTVTSATSIRGTELTTRRGDIDVRATREITGRARVTGPAGGLAIGAATLTGAADVTSAGNARIGTMEAGGAIAVDAQGSVTGLRAIDAAPAGINLVAEAGRVAVGGLASPAALEQAALGQVIAGAVTPALGAQVDAVTLSAQDIQTPGDTRLIAGRALVADRVRAGSLSTITLGAGTDVEGTVLATVNTAAPPAAPIGGVVASGSDWLAADAGFARLTAGGALTVTAGRGDAFTGAAQIGTLEGSSIAVTADALTIQRNFASGVAAVARTGSLALTATRGALYLGSALAAGGATLVKQGTGSGAVNADELRIGTLTATTEAATSLVADTIAVTSATGIRAARLSATSSTAPAALVATVTGGDVTGLFTPPAAIDGRLVADHDRADLFATNSGRTIAVAANGTAQLGTVTAGQGTSASRTLNQVVVRANAIDAATARTGAGTPTQTVTAANGNLVLEARTGAVRLGQGVAGGGAEEWSAATPPTYAAGIRAAGGVQIGTLTAQTGNIGVVATTGSVTGLITPSITGPGTGRANLFAPATDRVITVTAPRGEALLGTVAAGTGAASPIEQIGVDAQAIDVTAATTANGAIGLRATAARLVLGTGTAASSATLAKQGTADKLRVVTALTARDVVTLASTTDVDLGGPVRATAATGTILVDATAATPVALGSTADAASGFALTTAELNRLDAPAVTIDARANPLAIGGVSLGAAGANTMLRLLSTGDITLTGVVSALGVSSTGAVRTLQIGGPRATMAVDGTGIVQPADLAGSLTASLEGTTAGTGAGIQWTGGTVDLRARRLVFGDATLRSAVSGSNAAGIALNIVANPNSVLYRSTLGRTFLEARLLQVRYGEYALFQNAGTSATTNTGVTLNPGGTTTGPVALQLFAGGDARQDSFALFGTINGAINRSAGLLPETVLEFAQGGSSRVVRITQANSRVNGCVIGSPDRGCLNVDSPPPLIQLFDERQIQLFGTDENPDILFEPLIGTNNEGLIGDVSGIDATAAGDCPTGQEATCPPPTNPALQEVKP